ncbi:DNA primase regulatory subunit PriL [Natronomonas sp. F2-12]|jgi:DNA primase large subunit|uniref:DNA primase large subunit PriL n=1 Tax=Natronomonas aquatica TaxID=2841590 RepID=A0A9R1CT35_9EURY|nr:DNA primase regulatory subunit PriL [Natronomonas aquatica]MCQ4333091.1 DNA primase regulatory subunit PriL [Natronomonas aquatica]
MERLHARYPFLDASRAAVGAADVDLAELVAENGPAVERGHERVRRALLEGTTAPEEPRLWSTRAELLSYPIARVLVSLLDVPGATEKYAAAEATTARERFVEDFEADLELKSAAGDRLTLEELLADFDLSGGVDPVGDGRFALDVTAYLELAAGLDGTEWRLAGRPLSDGTVRVSRPELYTLLREAVAGKVAEGLPLSVPEGIAEPLSTELASIRRAIAELDPPLSFEAVAPGLFPPCMRALLSRIRDGETLSDHSLFSLVSFLLATGLDESEVIDLCSLSEGAAEMVQGQIARLRDEETTVAAPPSCAVMDEYGDCVDKDDLCETIRHPLSYYETRLRRTPEDRITDWRQ